MQRGLPTPYFTDRAIYDEETARIFSRDWLCLDRASCLDTVGSYHTYAVADRSLIVIRGSDRLRRFHQRLPSPRRDLV